MLLCPKFPGFFFFFFFFLVFVRTEDVFQSLMLYHLFFTDALSTGEDRPKTLVCLDFLYHNKVK